MSSTMYDRFVTPRRWVSRCALLSLCVALCACSRNPPAGSGRAYDVVQLDIGDNSILVEVACDHKSRQRGLMYRDKLADRQGMLFIFRKAEYRGFWMKNTKIPLAIAYIGDNGDILQIEQMKPHDEESTKSKHKVRFVLEMNSGWFARNGVKVGDVIPDLREKVAHFAVE